MKYLNFVNKTDAMHQASKNNEDILPELSGRRSGVSQHGQICCQISGRIQLLKTITVGWLRD